MKCFFIYTTSSRKHIIEQIGLIPITNECSMLYSTSCYGTITSFVEYGQMLTKNLSLWCQRITLTLYVHFYHRKHKHVTVDYATPLHGHDTGSWNHATWELAYSTKSISWVLMSCRRMEPCYWLCWTGLIRSWHAIGFKMNVPKDLYDVPRYQNVYISYQLPSIYTQTSYNCNNGLYKPQ